MQKIEYGQVLHAILNSMQILQEEKIKTSDNIFEIGPFRFMRTNPQYSVAIIETWSLAQTAQETSDWVNSSGNKDSAPELGFCRVLYFMKSAAKNPFLSPSDIVYASRIMYGNETTIMSIADKLAHVYKTLNKNPDPTFEREFFINLQIKAYIMLCGHILVQASMLNVRMMNQNKFAQSIPLTLNVLPKQAHYTNLRANKTAWGKIREVIIDGALDECEACDSDSDLEVHEEWEFLVSPAPPLLNKEFQEFFLEYIQEELKSLSFGTPAHLKNFRQRINMAFIAYMERDWDKWFHMMTLRKPYYLHQYLADLQCLCNACHSFKHINGTTDRFVKQYGEKRGLAAVDGILHRAIAVNELDEATTTEYVENCSEIRSLLERFCYTGAVKYSATRPKVQSIIASKADSYSKKLERRKMVDDGYGSF